MNPEIVNFDDEGVWVKINNVVNFINYAALYPNCVINLNINLDDYGDEPQE